MIIKRKPWLFEKMVFFLFLSCFLLLNYTNQWSARLYALIMSRTRFSVNLHSIVAWMSRNSLLKTGAKSEVRYRVPLQSESLFFQWIRDNKVRANLICFNECIARISCNKISVVEIRKHNMDFSLSYTKPCYHPQSLRISHNHPQPPRISYNLLK